MEDQQNDIMVSICCTAYNHEKYIEKALEGFIMQQCNFKFEILISDDASTDNTASIIKKYESKYPHLFKVFYLKENQYSKGNKPLFNILFPAAKGKYIALCEGDDYWTDPLKLQRQVDLLESNNQINLCFSSTNIIKEKSIIAKTRVDDRFYNCDEILLTKIAHTCTFFFRNKNWNLFPNSNKVFAGDLLLILFLTEDGLAKGMKDVMASYRKHDNGVSELYRNRDGYKHDIRFINQFLYIKKKFKKVSKKAINIKIVDHSNSVFFEFLRRKNPLFIKYLLISIYYRPELVLKAIKKILK